jgi:hypothetical protein
MRCRWVWWATRRWGKRASWHGTSTRTSILTTLRLAVCMPTPAVTPTIVARSTPSFGHSPETLTSPRELSLLTLSLPAAVCFHEKKEKIAGCDIKLSIWDAAAVDSPSHEQVRLHTRDAMTAPSVVTPLCAGVRECQLHPVCVGPLAPPHAQLHQGLAP